MASGGLRPGAPQNNPANVSGTGGAGQSGAATGFKYGMNKTINDQREQGSAALTTVAPTGMPTAQPQLPPVTGITAPSELPDQSVMDGASMGPGANSIPGLPTGVPDNVQFDKTIKSYAPVLNYVLSLPQTSKETRQILTSLLNGVQ